MALILSAANPNNYTANPYIDTFFQQTRWKRRDGHKASLQEGRAPTKKQRKAYNKSLQKQFGENPHGAPGSRAGPRREYYEALKEEWKEEDNTNDNNNELLEEYEMEDALLDDLMGNTKHLTSQPTPRPKYLGHNFAKYRDEIVRQMEVYHNRKSELEEENSSDTEAAALLVMESLPSDQSISLALRAFRDKHGTRQKPVGIVRALSYIMQDLGIPVSALSEYSFTTLLTCARTPKEGRRIMDLIKQQNHPISAYSWSILVDIYAKVGDYQGCSSVMDEMVQQNTPPGLAAYTSFLAACYKVCNDGRVAHSIRAKAAQASWEKWQEMRVVGVDPDVMAYGAMLRVCAALGHAERAINILEEMQQMEVKPTTLCFSSALRAVARSQAIAIRYENGASKRNRRREFLTSHHGKMAQSIVRLAESAHVEQDDGFVAALILCAGSVGDVATAKAIYVASEIRKMDHLRSIGPDQHLAQLRGDTIADELTAIEGSMQMVLDTNDSRNGLLSTQTGGYLDTLHPATSSRTSFEEREYGKDSRVLSAMLRACANAVDQNGIGTMWQGRENRGFLCEDSLRLLTAPRLPRYVDNSIPGQSTTDDLTWEGEDRDEDQKGQKRSTRAFKGIEELDETSLDNLDDLFEKIYLDKEGELKDEFKKTTPEDIWRMKYNDKESLALLDAIQGRPSVDRRSGSDPLSDGQLVDMFYDEATMSWTQNGRQSDRLVRETDDEDNEEMFFDFETMRWKTRQKILSNSEDKSNTSNLADGTDLNDTDRDKEGDNEELFFDVETMRWQTKPKRDVVANTGNTITEAQADANVEANAAASRGDNDNDDEDELYFDLEALRWKTRPKHEQANVSKRTKFESKILQESDELSAAKVSNAFTEVSSFAVLIARYLWNSRC
jgi:pentatricopeptide repeat protein